MTVAVKLVHGLACLPFTFYANYPHSEDHKSSALPANALHYPSPDTQTSPEATIVSTSQLDDSWIASTGGAEYYQHTLLDMPASPEATAASVFEIDASRSAPVCGADRYLKERPMALVSHTLGSIRQL